MNRIEQWAALMPGATAEPAPDKPTARRPARPGLTDDATRLMAIRAAQKAAADAAAKVVAELRSAPPGSDSDTLALEADAEATERAALEAAQAAARKAIADQMARVEARAAADQVAAAAAQKAADDAEYLAARNAARRLAQRRQAAVDAVPVPPANPRQEPKAGSRAEPVVRPSSVPQAGSRPEPRIEARADAARPSAPAGREAKLLAERAQKRRAALEQAAEKARRHRSAIDARYPEARSVAAAEAAPDARRVTAKTVPSAQAAAADDTAASLPVLPVARRNRTPAFRLDDREVADFRSGDEAIDTVPAVTVDAGSEPPEALIDTDPVKLRKRYHPKSRKVKIDLRELFAEGYLGEGAKEVGALGEEFRRIKRPLLANAYGQGSAKAVNGDRIMVTSALPNEGKSFCAIHLALSIASEVDTSVVLVEADIAKPTVLRKLGIRPHRGLTNWCADPRLDVRELVLDTEIEGFRIMPAGKSAPQSIDLLASRAMNTFFARLREAFPHDVIIVDAPPLLPATETKVLASLMGQVVVVVEAGETPKSVVTDALEMVKDVEIVGLVLNKSLRQSKNAGYGYGYGY